MVVDPRSLYCSYRERQAAPGVGGGGGGVARGGLGGKRSDGDFCRRLYVSTDRENEWDGEGFPG